ncbi:probable serine/threonine-protein kinase DDB_G0278535 [Drosophila innubila]|uniref:probable serine/threonine-protein kinase DDB_G0278535 n=1 Tax=Drosophila innubila TaxID=198719 RepID=UPI00148BC95F|nr:probable serine/threonine-protein kinase DDB_G0278535 [Drosophila innubila]
MSNKLKFGPPPDSDDSDDSSYDGFYFPDKLQREKVRLHVPRDQKLYDALLNGDLQRVCEEIDELHFPVDEGVCGGDTMLMHACRSGFYELASHLVNELKANVNKQVDSVMPLMLACDCQAKDPYVAEKLVRLLLNHGAVINVSDKYGMTPFMFACRKGFSNIVRLLIKDVSFDAVDNQGCTPIFFAIENNHAEIVKLLMEAGVNANIANNKGYTPKHVAEFHGFYDLLELLPRENPVYLVPSAFLSYNTLRDHVPRIFLKSDCPEYFQELNVILRTINMDNMLEHFAKSNTSLGEFLNMNDKKLRDIGVKFPIYRNKIMKGILDFHLHHWSKKSIARVKKDGIENFYDILMITANHLQHLVIIQSSLRFVIQNQLAGNLGQPSEMQLINLQNSLCAYRGVINDLTKTIKYLGSFSPPKSPLYIDYNEIIAERKRRKVRSYFKYTTIILGISVFICLKCKWMF